MTEKREELDAITKDNLVKLRKSLKSWSLYLTDWEYGFAQDAVERWRAFGPTMRASAKERNRIAEIVKKGENNGRA